nr:PREDICTED: lipase 3-like [Bemisia tabaci]
MRGFASVAAAACVALGVASCVQVSSAQRDNRLVPFTSINNILLKGILNVQRTFRSRWDRYRRQETNEIEPYKQTTDEAVLNEGYPAETHFVITDDGYILTLHRIPHGRIEDETPRKRPVVLVMHGILCSSTDWVITGVNESLGFVLADAGYDVWLGNARGNTYSRKHLKLDPARSPRKFWNFSFHEMGILDLPAMIDYVLNVTEQSSLSYVGHSMGTTMFYVLCSQRPEYNSKVRVMFSLAPVAYLTYVRSPVIRFLSTISDPLAWLCNTLGYYEFLPNQRFLSLVNQTVCQQGSLGRGICNNALFLIAGYDTNKLNKTFVPTILGHVPAGASSKTLTHFVQCMQRDLTFGQYDYGWYTNRQVYKNTRPPQYNLQNIQVPVIMFHSDNDWMSTPKDVNNLAERLPNLAGKFKISSFNHLDFMWAVSAKAMIYNRIVEMMDSYNDL